MSDRIENELALYKKMYHCLFNAITDLENYETKEEIIDFLKGKQLETEEIYISFGEE